MQKEVSSTENVREWQRGGGGPKRNQKGMPHGPPCHVGHHATWATWLPGAGNRAVCYEKHSNLSAFLSEEHGRPPHTPLQPAGTGLADQKGPCCPLPPLPGVSEQWGTGTQPPAEWPSPESSGRVVEVRSPPGSQGPQVSTASGSGATKAESHDHCLKPATRLNPPRVLHH